LSAPALLQFVEDERNIRSQTFTRAYELRIGTTTITAALLPPLSGKLDSDPWRLSVLANGKAVAATASVNGIRITRTPVKASAGGSAVINAGEHKPARRDALVTGVNHGMGLTNCSIGITVIACLLPAHFPARQPEHAWAERCDPSKPTCLSALPSRSPHMQVSFRWSSSSPSATSLLSSWTCAWH
jgi:hypothetical protein